MTLEEFNTLEDAEKESLLSTFNPQTVDNLEAERDSFKNELEELKEQYGLLKEENKKTKELNFTLGRRLNVENKKQDAEEILHDMFKRG